MRPRHVAVCCGAMVACVAGTAIAGPTTSGPIAWPVAWGGLGGGGAFGIDRFDHDCLPSEQRAEINRRIDEYLARNPGFQPAGSSGDGPVLYEFFPHAGNVWKDLFIGNFVDINPAPGAIQDWDCTQFTYDGHQGHDSILRSFAEQDLGVPIVAARDGLVVGRDDGHPDRNTVANPNAQPNYVALDHGNGRVTLYLHMRNGSVAVQNGQTVKAGEHLGMTASSGFSSWPHLHFETRINGVKYEPFTGACNAGASGWAAQTPVRRDTYAIDFAFSRVTLAGQTIPNDLTRTSNLGFGDQQHYFWVFVHNVPAQSTWRVRYYRPSGALEMQTNVNNFNNPFLKRGYFWFTWAIPPMSTEPGDWRMELEINGVIEVDATIRVNPVYDPGFNRAPHAVGATLDPAAPEAGDVIFCRVQTDLVNDDPDYDVVRYRYLWTVDGVPVRDAIHAGQADVLPSSIGLPGQVIACSVTPMDASLSGPPTIVTATLPSLPCGPDLTTGAIPGQAGYGVPDGVLNNDDFFYYLAQFSAGNLSVADLTTGAVPGQPGYGTPNGLLNNDDFFYYLTLFSAGC